MKLLHSATYELKKEPGRSLADQVAVVFASEAAAFRSGPYHNTTQIRMTTGLTTNPDGSGTVDIAIWKKSFWSKHLTSLVFYAVMFFGVPVFNLYIHWFDTWSFCIGAGFGILMLLWRMRRIKEGKE